MDLIAASYGSVAPRMGEFVRMMAERRWIEGSVGGRKRPGAYCTGFDKSRTPRVYMTYTGGASDVITLAHELGHAWHSWVMRESPGLPAPLWHVARGDREHVRRSDGARRLA